MDTNLTMQMHTCNYRYPDTTREVGERRLSWVGFFPFCSRFCLFKFSNLVTLVPSEIGPWWLRFVTSRQRVENFVISARLNIKFCNGCFAVIYNDVVNSFTSFIKRHMLEHKLGEFLASQFQITPYYCIEINLYIVNVL